MIKTYDVHMDPLERTSQIITLTEVINDILVSNSPSRDEKLKALLAILDLAVRDVHFLLEVKWSTKTGHRVRVFSSIDFPIRLVVTHHYIRAVLVRCNIQRYSPLLRELHR